MLLKVLERLDRRFSPHVLSLSELGDIGPRIRALGIPVEALGMRASRPSPVALLRLVRRLRSLAPDVVSTWMYHADLLGGIASRLAGVRAVGWSIRNSDLDPAHTKLATRLVVAACARISHWVPGRILCCSTVARRVHVESGYSADKMVVIPNGFDLTRFTPNAQARADIRLELGISRETPLIGVVGRFDPQKNHAGFLQSAAILRRQMPTVRFLLAGRGMDANNLALVGMIDRSGVGDATHLLGLRDDMPALMAALDVLVSSSAFGEAFPNVVGEAMACGVPCVVTDVGDSAYIVDDTGTAVPPGDNDALAQAVAAFFALSRKERTAMGSRARARVVDYFDIKQVVKQYEDFFDALAADGPVTGVGR
jgi:glycosyltransferase involved in cell wall biosynthesis